MVHGRAPLDGKFHFRRGGSATLPPRPPISALYNFDVAQNKLVEQPPPPPWAGDHTETQLAGIADTYFAAVFT
jgi:hypothetical protein